MILILVYSIVVAEMNHDSSGEESLAASSIVVAPTIDLPTLTSRPTVATTTLTTPSHPPSDDGSFDSSLSLLDAPSSPSDDEDEAIYRDTRVRLLPTEVQPIQPTTLEQDIEYVVLYDTASSGEE